jgi:hypothetical protein
LDFFAATSSSKGVGDNGGVVGMSSSLSTRKVLTFFRSLLLCCFLLHLNPTNYNSDYLLLLSWPDAKNYSST